jgi:hypothetical protein
MSSTSSKSSIRYRRRNFTSEFVCKASMNSFMNRSQLR